MSTRRSDDQLDTYLLRIFCLLITERSVSRTALRLNQSQPAVSLALKRLRTILGDPLLVREKSGMVPTERALALLSHAKGALAEIDRMTFAPESFEPQTSRYEFRVGAPDYLAPMFISSVVERIRKEAPNLRLSLQSLGPNFDFERSLAEGDLDVVIGNWPEPRRTACTCRCCWRTRSCAWSGRAIRWPAKDSPPTTISGRCMWCRCPIR